MTDAERLAAIRLHPGDGLYATQRNVKWLLNQLDAALEERDVQDAHRRDWIERSNMWEKRAEAAEQQVTALTQERDALKNADYADWGSGELLAHTALDAYPVSDPIPIKSTSVVFRIHQLGHAKEVIEQERDELIGINAGLTTEIMGVTHQLKEAEGRLGIVEVEDGKIQGIRITPARDLEYERRVRAEENLKVATDQLDAVTKDRDELDRTARELLDEARRQVTALRAALRDLIDAIPEETLVADPPLRCWVDQGEAALAGSRATSEAIKALTSFEPQPDQPTDQDISEDLRYE